MAGSLKLASQTIQPGQLENILIDLLENKQYKFEIWNNKPNTSQWERIKRGSPGNIQGLEDIFSNFSELENLESFTAAIRIGNDRGNKVKKNKTKSNLLKNIHFYFDKTVSWNCHL